VYDGDSGRIRHVGLPHEDVGHGQANAGMTSCAIVDTTDVCGHYRRAGDSFRVELLIDEPEEVRELDHRGLYVRRRQSPRQDGIQIERGTPDRMRGTGLLFEVHGRIVSR